MTAFTQADGIRAHEDWGCNCGPGALAAIMGMTLDQIRPHMGDFEKKSYTNPSLMFSALKSVGARWSKTEFGYSSEAKRLEWPKHGLARIQWGGPWMAEGAPPRWRYRQTHWVGSRGNPARGGGLGIFDINAMSDGGSGWVSREDWERVLVPWIIKECVPRADGKWHITHAIEIVPGIAPDHFMAG